MSRTFMAVLLSSALAFSSVSTSAWSQTDASVDQARNEAPLPPAGPARSIEEAQGFIRTFPILSLTIAAGLVYLVWILIDDEEETSTTGT
jgi:hypothetical protein